MFAVTHLTIVYFYNLMSREDTHVSRKPQYTDKITQCTFKANCPSKVHNAHLKLAMTDPGFSPCANSQSGCPNLLFCKVF